MFARGCTISAEVKVTTARHEGRDLSERGSTGRKRTAKLGFAVKVLN